MPKLHTTPPPPPRFPAYELLGLLEEASLREVRETHHRLVTAAYEDVDAAIENFDANSKMDIEHYLEGLDIALTELTVRPFLQPDQNPSNTT